MTSDTDPGMASEEATGPSGSSEAPITLADAETALAAPGGDIPVITANTDEPITPEVAERELQRAGSVAALQARVEPAFTAMWQRAFGAPGNYALGYELRRVRREVAAFMANKPPERIAAALVLLAAERRWSAVPAASLHPLDALAAHIPATAKPPPSMAPAIIARLASRGITLAVDDAGRIVAMPAHLLNQTDRAQLSEHKAELVRALASWEVVA